MPSRNRQPNSLCGAIAVGLGICLVGANAAAQGIGSHLGVGVVAGEAAGLDDGYVHFGGFVPVAQADGQSLVFVDGSLLLFDESNDAVGGSVGLGSRSYCEATDTILGGSFYFDRRDSGIDEFNQIGVGIESLGDTFDARLNVAIPLNDSEAGSIALSTIDAELGALLTANDWAQFRAFIAAYGLFNDEIDDTAGVRGRFEVRIADRCFVGGYLEHDDVFDTTGGFTLEYRFGNGGAARDSSAANLLARLGDPVRRRRHVVVAENASVGLTTTGLGITSTGGPTPGGPTVTPGGTIDDPTIDPTGRGARPAYRPTVRKESL